MSATIEAEIATLESIKSSTYPDVETQRDALNSSMTSAQTITTSIDVNTSVATLRHAEHALSNQSQAIIQSALTQFQEEIELTISTFEDDVTHLLKNEFGRCRSLYDSFKTIVYAPCVYFLYPLNGLWFCYGWFSVFSILAILLSKCIASFSASTHARKQVSAQGSDFKSLGVNSEDTSDVISVKTLTRDDTLSTIRSKRTDVTSFDEVTPVDDVIHASSSNLLEAEIIAAPIEDIEDLESQRSPSSVTSSRVTSSADVASVRWARERKDAKWLFGKNYRQFLDAYSGVTFERSNEDRMFRNGRVHGDASA